MFDPLSHETPKEDIDALVHLCDLLNAKDVVEVGTWAGGTALALAKRTDATVYCVDHWQGNPDDRLGAVAAQIGTTFAYNTFLANCREYLFSRIVPCFGRSKMWADLWPVVVDLVFIDADHRYYNIKQDIEAWLPHIRPGGIICGHDYGVFQGVNRAADELKIDGVAGKTVWWKQV